MLGVVQHQTQHNLQALLSGTYRALAGRGQDLNNAIGNLDPSITELSAVVGVLNQQSGNVRSLINNAATVLTTLGDRSVRAAEPRSRPGDQVFSATAARNVALTRPSTRCRRS